MSEQIAEKVKTAVQEVHMTDMELLEDRLEHIENNIGTLYITSERMFAIRDKRADTEITTEMRLLVDIGMRVAAMQICCNKIKVQLEVLKDLESEEKE